MPNEQLHSTKIPGNAPIKAQDATEDRKPAALDYHEFPTPGKISNTATKWLINQSDPALAYSAAAVDADRGRASGVGQDQDTSSLCRI